MNKTLRISALCALIALTALSSFAQTRPMVGTVIDIDEGRGRLQIEYDDDSTRVLVETDSVSTVYYGFGTAIAGKPEIFTGTGPASEGPVPKPKRARAASSSVIWPWAKRAPMVCHPLPRLLQGYRAGQPHYLRIRWNNARGNQVLPKRHFPCMVGQVGGVFLFANHRQSHQVCRLGGLSVFLRYAFKMREQCVDEPNGGIALLLRGDPGESL